MNLIKVSGSKKIGLLMNNKPFLNCFISYCSDSSRRYDSTKFGIGIITYDKSLKTFVIWNNIINDYRKSENDEIENLPFTNIFEGFCRYRTNINLYINYSCDNIINYYNNIFQNNKKLLIPFLNRIKFHELKDEQILCHEMSSEIMLAFTLFGKKPNILSWALNMLTNRVNNFTPFLMLKIHNWLEYNENHVNKLSKKNLVAYCKENDIKLLTYEIDRINYIRKGNIIINKFNTAQRNIIKASDLAIYDYFLFTKLGNLNSERINNIIKKVSTFNNFSDIISCIENEVLSKYEWSLEKFIEYITYDKSLSYDIVYNENNIILLRVYDFHTIKVLGKSTNWCISKGKQYWDDYVANSDNKSQYMLFNFNELVDSEYSIIGITCSLNGIITHSHSFTNKDLFNVTEYVFGKIFGNIDNLPNILSILDTLKISNNNLIANNNNLINQNYLKTKIKENALYCDILYEQDDKLLLTTKKSLFEFLPSNYNSLRSLFEYMPLDNGIILWCDFSKPINDCNRILFSSYTYDKNISGYDYDVIFNLQGKPISLNFDEIIGLQVYSLLNRPRTIIDKFIFSIKHYDFTEFKHIISTLGISFIKENAIVYYTLKNAIIDDIKFKYNNNIVKALEECNLHLYDIFTKSDVVDIIVKILKKLNNDYDLKDILEYQTKEKHLNGIRLYSTLFRSLCTFDALKFLLKNEINNKILVLLLSVIIYYYDEGDDDREYIEYIDKFIIKEHSNLLENNELAIELLIANINKFKLNNLMDDILSDMPHLVQNMSPAFLQNSKI